MTTVSLEGLQSGVTGEDRAIAILKVEHNGQTYDWQRYVPAGVDLSDFISGLGPSVGAEIDAKEAEWAALTPIPTFKGMTNTAASSSVHSSFHSSLDIKRV